MGVSNTVIKPPERYFNCLNFFVVPGTWKALSTVQFIILGRSWQNSVAFPDPGSEFLPSRIRIRIKEFWYFSPKNRSKVSEIRSRMLIPGPDPGSGSWFFTHPDSGSSCQKGTGSRIRIRNSAWQGRWFPCICNSHNFSHCLNPDPVWFLIQLVHWIRIQAKKVRLKRPALKYFFVSTLSKTLFHFARVCSHHCYRCLLVVSD